MLQLSFEGWQRAVHAHQSWPALWRRETMRSIGRSTTLAALLSGALSEVLYRLCDDRRAPLLMSALVALVAAGLTMSTADAPLVKNEPLCGGDAESGLGRFFEFPRDTSGGRSVRGAVVTAGAAIVDADTVGKIRAMTSRHNGPWTVKSLELQFPDVDWSRFKP